MARRKGEKVDYALLHDDQPAVLIECKMVGANLNAEPPAQLARYFACAPARFGVLTDGAKYHFYADLDKANTMDSAPFLTFDFLNYRDEDIDGMRRFTKAAFNHDTNIECARSMKYRRGVLLELDRNLLPVRSVLKPNRKGEARRGLAAGRRSAGGARSSASSTASSRAGT